MATYIQGLTDYIPQVQPFKPDFNFYNNVLARKQQQYDAGWQQINTVYNSMLNAPMLRDTNNERRDQFFQQAEQEIQRLSGVDLSLQQNVDAANSIFKPFYEDDNIVNDIAWTKKYQNELSMAESFRTCKDPKKCGGKYWDGGVRALNYKANEFRNMSDQDALDFRAPTYTPYKNIMKMATEAVKDAGLSTKYDSKEGGYIVTTKNGESLQIPLMNYFSQLYGDDPEVQSFYRTKAYLLGKENPEGAKALYDQGVAPEEATPEAIEGETVRQNFEKEAEYVTEKAGIESNRLEILQKKKAALDKSITKKGIDPNSKKGKEYIQLLEDIEAQKRISTNMNKTAETAGEIRAQNQTQGASNAQMEGVIAQGLMMKDLWGAAQVLSYKDYERTMKVDQYGLESVRQQNRISMMNAKHDLSMESLGIKHTFMAQMQRQKFLMNEGVIDPNSMTGAGGYQGVDATIYGNFGGASPIPTAPVYQGGGGGGSYGGYNPNLSRTQNAYNRGRAKGQVMMGEAGPMAMPGVGGAGQPLRGIGSSLDPTISSQGQGESVSDMSLPAQIALGKKLDEIGDSYWGLGKHMTDIEQYRPNSIDAVNTYAGKLQSFITSWKENGVNAKQELNNEYVRKSINIASNSADQVSADAMQLEMLPIGDNINNSFDAYDRALRKVNGDNEALKDSWTVSSSVEAIANLTPEQREKFRMFPSSRHHATQNMNNDYFASLSNDWEAIIDITGGHNNFHKNVVGTKGTWVVDPETKLQGVSDLDEATYVSLQNKQHDISADKFQASVDKVPYTGPELTDEEREQLKMGEHLESTGGFERAHGMTSEIPEMAAFMAANETLNSNLAIIDASAEKATNTFNQAGKNAADYVIGQYTREQGPMQHSIAKHLWIEGENGGYGRLATKSEVFNGLVEDDVHATGTWFSSRETLGDVFTDNTWTLAQGEQRLGVTFNNENALKLMSKSEANELSGDSYLYDMARDLHNINNAETGKGLDPKALTVAVRGIDEGPLDDIYKYRKYLNITRTGENNGKLEIDIKPEYAKKYGASSIGYSFDLSQVEVDDSYWEVLHDRAEPAWEDVGEQFARQFQNQESVFSNEQLGGGQGSFTASELSMHLSPLKKYDANYAHGMEMLGELVSNAETTFGGGDTGFLSQLYADYQVGRNFSKSSNAIPNMQMQVKPISGELGTSEVTITVNPQYLHKLGYNKIVGGEYTNIMSSTQTYKIKNSQSKLVTNAMPNMFDALLSSKGDSYTEPTFADDVGTFTYTNTGGGNVQVSFNAEIFDVETGTMRPAAYPVQNISMNAQNWQLVHNEFLETMKAIKAENAYNQAMYNEVMGIYNPQELSN